MSLPARAINKPRFHVWASLWLCAACTDNGAPKQGAAPNDSEGSEEARADAAQRDGGAARPGTPTGPDDRLPAYGSWPDPLRDMPHGPDHTAEVCLRPSHDSVHALFCSGEPAPTSLAELQARLGVGTDKIGPVSGLRFGDLTALSVTAHSTAVSKRSVSSINPRAIALRVAFKGEFERDMPAAADGVDEDAGVALPVDASRMLALGFARGEQLAEIIASDDTAGVFRFYVVGFQQACNAQPTGCALGDLLTGAIETNWTEVTLYDEKDFENTVLDCAPCHQPQGPGTHKLLRMQELDVPWTHWFSPTTEGGRALLDDYLAAHGDETYAGMTAEQMQQADPNSLASMVFLDTPVQPNEFDSTLIEVEIKDSAAAEGGNQPTDNTVRGRSATWETAFGRASTGEAISVPYHNVKVTDATKLTEMTAAYQAYRKGELSQADLPDIRDVFPDDPVILAEMGVGTMPGLDGEAVLVTACAQCHNERLDQSLSRARFRADLDGMSRAEKDVAIARLELPPEHPQAMPPARMRELSPAARKRAIEALRR